MKIGEKRKAKVERIEQLIQELENLRSDAELVGVQIGHYAYSSSMSVHRVACWGLYANAIWYTIFVATYSNRTWYHIVALLFTLGLTVWVTLPDILGKSTQKYLLATKANIRRLEGALHDYSWEIAERVRKIGDMDDILPKFDRLHFKYEWKEEPDLNREHIIGHDFKVMVEVPNIAEELFPDSIVTCYDANGEPFEGKRYDANEIGYCQLLMDMVLVRIECYKDTQPKIAKKLMNKLIHELEDNLNI